jgi:hypothetical protein
MMGLQHQPDAGFISIQFGTGTLGTYPLVGLEVEGSASAPSFLCEYPDPANTCTFRKISWKHSNRTPDDTLAQLQQGTARL